MDLKFAEVPDGLAAILDPVGLTADGGAEDFQRRRQTELTAAHQHASTWALQHAGYHGILHARVTDGYQATCRHPWA